MFYGEHRNRFRTGSICSQGPSSGGLEEIKLRKEGYLKQLEELAKNRGGHLLSVVYIWIKRKQKENSKKLEEIKFYAQKKNNLICLDSEYISCDTPMVFICKNSHKWKIAPKALKIAIKNGRYCKHCNKI